jgi:hypothetical protein
VNPSYQSEFVFLLAKFAVEGLIMLVSGAGTAPTMAKRVNAKKIIIIIKNIL